MFAETPDTWWWIALANLTQWFYWPAWAAIFSALALWNTARLADRANRQARHKDAVFLMSVREMLTDVVQLIEHDEFFAEYLSQDHPDANPESLTSDQRASTAARFREINETIWKDDRAFENIEAIKLSDFPSVYSFMAFSTARIGVGMVRANVSKFDGSDKSTEEIWGWAEGILEGSKKLEREAGKLSSLAVQEYYTHEGEPQRAMSLKSLPIALRTTWTGLPFPWRRQKASTEENA